MAMQSVLIETKHPNSTTVFGTSGTLFNSSFAITTSNEIARFSFHNPGKNEESVTQEDLVNNLKKSSFFIYVKNDTTNEITEYTAHFKKFFHSNKIKESSKLIFRKWSFHNSHDYKFEWLSPFILLELDGVQSNLHDFECLLNEMPKTPFFKGQGLTCISSAFGNKEFINHFSKGIVSNVLGKDNCLIFSDMPLTPGSEGSPVFLENSSKVAVGIVISSVNWWKGEWLNFTVITDLRLLFSEIFEQNYLGISRNPSLTEANTALLRSAESSLFQIYNGTIWGTAILINKEQGILITNSHLVDSPYKQTIQLYQKSRMIPCEVIYSNPVDYSLDIAVLKAMEQFDDGSRNITLSEIAVKSGDPVFAAGYPVFPKEVAPGVTITRGHVCHVHPCMLKTTCPVFPGSSGGAILDEIGNLIAVVVCNAKTSEPINMVYPRLNMSIPMKLLQPILEKYTRSEDVKVLEELSNIDSKIWNFSFKL